MILNRNLGVEVWETNISNITVTSVFSHDFPWLVTDISDVGIQTAATFPYPF